MADTALNPHQAPNDRTPLAAMQRALIHEAMRESVAAHPIPQSVLEMSLRPVDVVHIRKQMVEWWGQRGEWQYRYALQGRRPIDPNDDNDVLDAEVTRRWMVDSYRQAELYWVSTEMAQLVTSMAPTIPDCIPEPPCPNGFVIFARSIPGLDAESGTMIYTTAYLWATVQTKIGWCWAIETFAWRDLLHVWRMMDQQDRELFRQVMPLRLHPTGGSEWPCEAMTSDFSRLPASNAQMEASMLEDRRILATFWALCSQRIALQETYKPDRGLLRQAKREGWRSIPQVKVIRLREPVARSEHGAGREVEWSHRWLVGEHWRRQWYPSDGQHRPKLVQAYVKGPADKPLVIRPTVKALVR